MIHIEYFTFNAFQERCSVVWDEAGNCAIVDPGFYTEGERDRLYNLIDKNNLCVKAILLTHGHFDHIFHDLIHTILLEQFFVHWRHLFLWELPLTGGFSVLVCGSIIHDACYNCKGVRESFTP